MARVISLLLVSLVISSPYVYSADLESARKRGQRSCLHDYGCF